MADRPIVTDRPRVAVDQVTLQIVANALASIADEMATTIVRTAHSTVVRDGMDFSAALCDARGETVAQAVSVPFHLGSIPTAMESLLAHYGERIRPGDVFVMNDPFDGGMHLQDIFIVKPVHFEGVVIGYADGCDTTCAAGGTNNHGADATIARQNGGPSLFGTTPAPTAIATTPPTATAPSAPQSLTATRGGKAGSGISLAWAAPATNGGSPVSGYTVYRRTSSSTAQAISQVPGTTTTYKDLGVTSGTTYIYDVTATNSVGVSPPSNDASATAR